MSTLSLGQKQRRFVQMIGRLIEFAYGQGYELSFGEAYRTPEQAAMNARSGKGIVNSLHTQRLAIDLNLFRNGVYLTRSEDYELLGKRWESMGGAWGGRFSKPDGNHFSIEHQGVR